MKGEEEMKKAEYDFLTWRNFPSSAKITNDEVPYWGGPFTRPFENIAVKPGSSLNVKIQGKQQDVIGPDVSRISVYGFDGSTWKYITGINFPLGTFDWREFELKPPFIVPNNIQMISGFLAAGKGTPGVTWFDDLKIYQDDVLIYSNDFSDWSPVIGAGVGAPIGGVAGYLLKEPLGPMVSEVVGAVVGGALGGGIGLLTGLGIIPVPQIPIPSLGAAPEGPGAPMRLGKYQITG